MFEFKSVAGAEIRPRLDAVLAELRAGGETDATFTSEALDFIAGCAGGDVRKALTLLELTLACAEGAEGAEGAGGVTVDEDFVRSVTPSVAAGRFDADGDVHYDLLSCLQGVVGFGFFAMLLKASRGREVQRGMLLDGFGSLVPVLLLVLLTKLIVTLGFLLLILPGIWALYSYRMARYLMILHPEYRVTDCLRLSRLRMRGHKIELFLLDLSFLGWALLLIVPLVGLAVAVWALPYWNCSCALFFEEINAGLESPDGNQSPA